MSQTLGEKFVKKMDVTIDKKLELCTEIASEVIKRANKYKSEIWVENDGKKANAKSLLGLVSLGLATWSSLTISAEGEDEHEAVKCLKKMFSVSK